MIRRLVAGLRARRAAAHADPYTPEQLAEMRRRCWRLIRGVRR